MNITQTHIIHTCNKKVYKYTLQIIQIIINIKVMKTNMINAKLINNNTLEIRKY